MKHRLFIFAVFLLLVFTAGCAAENNMQNLQGQNMNLAGNNAGQGQRMDGGLYTGQSQWPGDTVDDYERGRANVTGGSAVDFNPVGGKTGGDLPYGAENMAVNDVADNTDKLSDNPAGNHAAAGAGGNAAGNGIRLLNIKNPVKRGETGFLSIQGKPSVRYTISAVYNKGGKTFSSAIEKTSGTDGIVSWVWSVSSDTLPGTYNITVTGGGDVFTTAYTVE